MRVMRTFADTSVQKRSAERARYSAILESAVVNADAPEHNTDEKEYGKRVEKFHRPQWGVLPQSPGSSHPLAVMRGQVRTLPSRR